LFLSKYHISWARLLHSLWTEVGDLKCDFIFWCFKYWCFFPLHKIKNNIHPVPQCGYVKEKLGKDKPRYFLMSKTNLKLVFYIL